MKSYKLKMLPLAEADLSEIVDYLSDFSETTALNQYDRIIEIISALKQFPLLYAEYKINGTSLKYRRMVVDNYSIFYVVFQDHIEIHRMIHAKMDMSKIFNGI